MHTAEKTAGRISLADITNDAQCVQTDKTRTQLAPYVNNRVGPQETYPKMSNLASPRETRSYRKKTTQFSIPSTYRMSRIFPPPCRRPAGRHMTAPAFGIETPIKRCSNTPAAPRGTEFGDPKVMGCAGAALHVVVSPPPRHRRQGESMPHPRISLMNTTNPMMPRMTMVATVERIFFTSGAPFRRPGEELQRHHPHAESLRRPAVPTALRVVPAPRGCVRRLAQALQ